MEAKGSHIKCWICKDSGMVFFMKYKYKIKYELAYRCTCIKGQTSSKQIMTVPIVLAENIAIENYKVYQKVDSAEVLRLKNKISIGSILS